VVKVTGGGIVHESDDGVNDDGNTNVTSPVLWRENNERMLYNGRMLKKKLKPKQQSRRSNHNSILADVNNDENN
jgi:hypothetical protein